MSKNGVFFIKKAAIKTKKGCTCLFRCDVALTFQAYVYVYVCMTVFGKLQCREWHSDFNQFILEFYINMSHNNTLPVCIAIAFQFNTIEHISMNDDNEGVISMLDIVVSMFHTLTEDRRKENKRFLCKSKENN